MNKLRMKKTTKITLRIQPFIMNQHSKKLSISVIPYVITVITFVVELLSLDTTLQSSACWSSNPPRWTPGSLSCGTVAQHKNHARRVHNMSHLVEPCLGSFQQWDVTLSLSEWGDIVASPDTKPWNRSVASEDLVYCGWFRLLGCCFLQKLRSEPPWR